MRRFHLIEIEDQSWCPGPIRDAATDYLQHVIVTANAYGPIAGRLAKALRKTNSQQVIDLCSGGGGPWLGLYREFADDHLPVAVCLTDLYVNHKAFKRAESLSNGRLAFHPEPVDATHVPAELAGFRTLFTSFHHFTPEQARAILRAAVNARRGIGVFEATQRSIVALLSMCLTPLMVWLFTPFIRPFKWSRLLWTYAIPIVPLVVMFDGIVSCLRTYTISELQQLAAELPEAGYKWEIGQEKGRGSPMGVTYLIGYPVESMNADK